MSLSVDGTADSLYVLLVANWCKRKEQLAFSLAKTQSEAGPKLVTANGELSGPNTICRALAAAAGPAISNQLLGQSPAAEAEVSQWLTWRNTANHPGHMSASARLEALNVYLAPRAVLAGLGTAISLADLATFSLVHSLVAALPPTERASLPHLMRWFDYIQMKGDVDGVYEKLPVEKAKFRPPAPQPPTPKAAPAASKGVTVGSSSATSANGPSPSEASSADKPGKDKKDKKEKEEKDKDKKGKDEKEKKDKDKNEKDDIDKEKKDKDGKHKDDKEKDGKDKDKKEKDGKDKDKKERDEDGKDEKDEKDKDKKDKKEKKEKKEKPPAQKKEVDTGVSVLDIRVGEIKKVWKHPGADTLYVEEIDLGEGQVRQVVSGLAKFLTEEEMLGRRVLVLKNVKAGKVRDVVSAGLVLCASNEDHSQCQPVVPPAGAAIGERVTFEGHDGAPEEVLNPKKKQLEKIQPDLRTDSSGVAAFQGVPFMTSAGPCTSSIFNATIK